MLVAALATMTVATDVQAQGAPRRGAAIAAARARVAEAQARFVAAVEEGRRGPAEAGPMRAAALARLDALAGAMEDAPGVVLDAALSPAARAAMPAAVRDLLEQDVDLDGAVDVIYEIHRQAVLLRHTLDTAQGRVRLHLDGEPPAWTSGQRVRVRGVRVRDDVAAAGGATTTANGDVLAALPNVGGDQKALMMLVNFSDQATQPYTVDYARGVLFNTTSAFMHENSSHTSQPLTFSGDVTRWLTLPMSSTVCDYSTLATQANSAAAAEGYNLSAYSRYVYAFPDNACAWWGLGSVGGNPSRSWVNGTLVLDVLGHELGHNLGLYHSHSMDCGAAAVGGTCTTSEYGDTLDMMGGTKGHFNAFQKERLGWLASSQIVSVPGGGTYTVEPYSGPSGGVKALKVLKGLDASGRRTYYYVEFRQAVGFDAFMASWSNVMNGVAIRLGTESSPSSSYLLDMTPGTNSWYDPALAVGQSFVDAESGVTISVQSASTAGALVSVVLGPGTCTPQAPTMTVGAAASVPAGSAATFSVQVTNRDSVACGASTFELTAPVGAGWTSSLSPASVALSPGASATATLTVASPSSMAAGSYDVAVRATDVADATRTASATASYAVLVPRTATVSTNQATYTRGQTVVTTSRVTANGAPVSGVAVAIQYRKSDGRLVNATMTTDATGTAVHRLTLRKREPVGFYDVTATSTGAPAATSRFEVR